jgi:hypothetical protein
VLLDRAQEGNILTLLGSSRKHGCLTSDRRGSHRRTKGVGSGHVAASAALRSGATVLCRAEALVENGGRPRGASCRIPNHFALARTCRAGPCALQELSCDGSDLAHFRNHRGPVPTGPVRAREEPRLHVPAASGDERAGDNQTLRRLSDSDRRLTDAAGPAVYRALRGGASTVVGACRSRSTTPHRAPDLLWRRPRTLDPRPQRRARSYPTSLTRLQCELASRPSRTPAQMRTFAHAPDRPRSSARLMRFLCWESVTGSARGMPTTAGSTGSTAGLWVRAPWLETECRAPPRRAGGGLAPRAGRLRPSRALP